jgi:hypothetical protein
VVQRFFSPTEMVDFKEQRICIKFCFKLKKNAAETHQMLKEAFGDNAISQSKTFLWYKRFKGGRTSVDDDERSGRPSTSTTPENIAKVREAILADRRRTIHDVREIVGLSCGTVQRILWDDLNMRRIAAKFVPRQLSNDQKEHRVAVCKQQSSQWKSPNSPRPKKTRQVRSNVKSMLIVFFFLTSKALSTRNSSPWSNYQRQVLL